MPSKTKKTENYSLRNRVTLVRGGKEYFSLLLKMINQAGYCIHLQYYIYDDDETGTMVTEALKKAVKKGVTVYLHVDGYASQKLSRQFRSDIKEAGVRLKFFGPLFKSKHFYFSRRMHHKVAVVDGLYSLVGGINVCNRYNDMPDKPAWLDMALYCEGEASYLLYRICRGIWGSSVDKDVLSQDDIEKFCNSIPKQEQHPVRLIRNDWVKRKQQISKFYLEMFNNASEKITIMCSYFLPGRLFRKRLSQAVKRGVKTRIILAGPSDVMMAKHAERYLYDWLLKNNIEIYEYQKTVLHAKIAVYDSQWMTVGSYNVNNISAYASLELNMEVKNKDFAIHSENELEQIITNDCKKINPENYTSSTNFWRRVWQRTCYEFINNVLNLFTFYFRQE